MKSEINKNGAKVRKKFHPLYLKLMNLVEDKTPILLNPEKLDEIKKNYFDKNIPVSFCANHTNSHDIPVAAKALKKHFYVMIAKEGLTPVQKIGFFLNGAIFIKRDDKKSRKSALLKLISAQKNNLSTLVYAEASWNTKEEKLMNKLYTGIVDASKESGADIVPVVFEYINDNCYVKICDPIKVDKNKDSRLQVDYLRDIMATMKYEILEEKTDFYPERRILKEIESIADNWDKLPSSKYKRLEMLRCELNSVKQKAKEKFCSDVENNWKNCPGLDREFEESCIYKDGDLPYDVFSHLNKININSKTKFLFNPNVTGYIKK